MTFENNARVVAQVATDFIKAHDVTPITPNLFGYMQYLVETNQVVVTKIESEKNISDMLTKALPAYQHREFVCAVGMKRLQELSNWNVVTLILPTQDSSFMSYLKEF